MSFCRLAAGILLAVPLFAAELRGIVRDQTEVCVPNVHVALRAKPPGKVVTEGKTDQSGEYAFTGLDAGVYEIELSRLGFKTVRLSDVHVAAEDRKRLDPITISVAMSVCPIVVTAGPDPV